MKYIEYCIQKQLLDYSPLSKEAVLCEVAEMAEGKSDLYQIPGRLISANIAGSQGDKG